MTADHLHFNFRTSHVMCSRPGQNPQQVMYWLRQINKPDLFRCAKFETIKCPGSHLSSVFFFATVSYHVVHVATQNGIVIQFTPSKSSFFSLCCCFAQNKAHYRLSQTRAARANQRHVTTMYRIQLPCRNSRNKKKMLTIFLFGKTKHNSPTPEPLHQQ